MASYIATVRAYTKDGSSQGGSAGPVMVHDATPEGAKLQAAHLLGVSPEDITLVPTNGS